MTRSLSLGGRQCNSAGQFRDRPCRSRPIPPLPAPTRLGAPQAKAASLSGTSAHLSRRAWRIAASRLSAGRMPLAACSAPRATMFLTMGWPRSRAICVQGTPRTRTPGAEGGRLGHHRAVVDHHASRHDLGPELGEARLVEGDQQVGMRGRRREHLLLGEVHVRIRGAAPRLGPVARDVGGVEALVDGGAGQEQGRGLGAVAPGPRQLHRDVGPEERPRKVLGEARYAAPGCRPPPRAARRDRNAEAAGRPTSRVRARPS